MAEAGNGGADQDFAQARIGQADILDDERLVDFIKDGSLHRRFLALVFFIPPEGKGEVLFAAGSLRRQKQFANLTAAGCSLAKQQRSDHALRRTFREPERISRG